MKVFVILYLWDQLVTILDPIIYYKRKKKLKQYTALEILEVVCRYVFIKEIL